MEREKKIDKKSMYINQGKKARKLLGMKKITKLGSHSS